MLHRDRDSHFGPRLLDTFDAIAPKLSAKINKYGRRCGPAAPRSAPVASSAEAAEPSVPQ
jgi:hypothetical protein